MLKCLPCSLYSSLKQTPRNREKRTQSLTSRCNFAKIDLILILDASTSRESVFEHQKEVNDKHAACMLKSSFS